ADYHAGDGLRRCREDWRRWQRARGVRRRIRLREFRQPEVQDLHAVIGRDENVLGFQIAMDDAFFMRRRETARDLNRVIDRLLEGEAADLLTECLPFEQFRDDVRRSIRGSNVMDPEN